MNIPAMQSQYRGYRFRSRLEARWAIFFDALGVQWQYEPETFDLTDRYASLLSEYSWMAHSSPRLNPNDRLIYTPDFLLPNVRGGLYVEIKPYQQAEWWGNHAQYPFLYEKVCICLEGVIAHGEPGTRKDETYEVLTGGDTYHYFGYCSHCGAFGEGYCAWAERICADHAHCGHSQKDDMTTDPAYIEAVTCSRYALFTGGICNADYRRSALTPTA